MLEKSYNNKKKKYTIHSNLTTLKNQFKKK